MRTILAFALASALPFMSVVRAEDAIKPDDEGFIRDWLVLAPLPFGAAQSGTDALAKEQVPGEAKLRPKEGDKVKVGDQALTWKKHKCDSHLLDLNAFLGKETEDSVGYAVCYLVTGEKMENLTMNQAKVYRNGKEVFTNEEARPTDKDQDSTLNLTLDKGVNTIVFKIVNEKVDWSGCLRFTDKDGKPIKNIEVRLKP